MGRSMKASKLPQDYRLDALAKEADKRAKQSGLPYSYGKLVADTTESQRDEIAEGYRRNNKRSQEKCGQRHSFSDMEEIAGD